MGKKGFRVNYSWIICSCCGGEFKGLTAKLCQRCIDKKKNMKKGSSKDDSNK